MLYIVYTTFQYLHWLLTKTDVLALIGHTGVTKYTHRWSAFYWNSTVLLTLTFDLDSYFRFFIFELSCLELMTSHWVHAIYLRSYYTSKICKSHRLTVDCVESKCDDRSQKLVRELFGVAGWQVHCILICICIVDCYVCCDILKSRIHVNS